MRCTPGCDTMARSLFAVHARLRPSATFPLCMAEWCFVTLKGGNLCLELAVGKDHLLRMFGSIYSAAIRHVPTQLSLDEALGLALA